MCFINKATANAELKASNVENPYESPATPPRAERKEPIDRSPSWGRGLVYAVPLFFVGAAIPFLIPPIYFVVAALSGTEADPDLFESALTLPSVACGLLFALAAIRNYSPAQSEGLMTGIARVGFAGIVWVFIVSWIAFLFIPVHQSFGPDPWLPLRALIVVSVPVCYTYFSTKKRMVNQTPPKTRRSE